MEKRIMDEYIDEFLEEYMDSYKQKRRFFEIENPGKFAYRKGGLFI